MTRFDRLLSFMTKPLVAASYVGFIVLSFLYFDKPVAYYFHSLNLGPYASLLHWITKIGLGVIYFSSLLLMALFFRYVKRNQQWETRAWFLWLCVLIPSLVCLLLKIVFGRARPDLLFRDQLYGFYGMQIHAPFWSFPSGHTTTVMGLVFGLCALFPRYCLAFILPGVIVVSTRILLTQHFLSDVLTAGYLALLEVVLLYCWLRRTGWMKSAYGQVI